MKIFIVIFFNLYSLCSFAGDNFDVLGMRVSNRNMNIQSIDSIINYLKYSNVDGSFSDIDYSISTEDVWPARKHYYRIWEMTCAFSNPESDLYGDSFLYDSILKSLYYWCEKKPNHSNWWFSTIEEPQMLGMIAIKLKYGNDYNFLPSDLEANLSNHYESIRKSPNDYSGANQSQIAIHWFYWGIIEKNNYLLITGITTLYDGLTYSLGSEGLKLDNSFLSGGIYIGAYGEQFLSNILQIVSYTHDTEYSPSNYQLWMLRNYFINTYSSFVRGRVMAYNAMGRSVTYKDFLCNILSSYALDMAAIDSEYYSTYMDIYLRMIGLSSPDTSIKPLHHHYWLGDYTIHTRNKYNFGCRITSSRSCRAEHGNGEGECTYYMSDGSTWLARSGEEYNNIMPLWDWGKIPGTTSPNLDSIPMSKPWTVYGITDFSGGVSDSIYGCSAYQYFDENSMVNTGGNKGYFFFDDEILCLGSNMHSEHDFHTTVEQNWGKDSIIVCCGGEIKSLYGCFPPKYLYDVRWILHDSIGYYFPDACDVVLSNDSTYGNWNRIAKTQEDKNIRGKVFTLTIPHRNNMQSNYKYVLLPSIDKSGIERYIKDSTLKIYNTDSVQIVSHESLNITECVFYKPCQIIFDKFNVKVDNPVLLLLKSYKDSLVVNVADPLQNQKPITIIIKDIDSGISGSIIHQADYDQMEGMSKRYVVQQNSSNSLNAIAFCDDIHQIKVFSLSGQLLYVIKDASPSHIGHLIPPGIYVIEVDGKERIYNRKYIYKKI